MNWKLFMQTMIGLFTDLATDQITGPGGIQEPLETPAWNAEWAGRKRGFIHPLQRFALYVKVISTEAVGMDEQRKVYMTAGEAAGDDTPSGESNLYNVACGYRRVILQVQSWCAEDTDTLSGHHVIDRVRTRLGWDRSFDLMIANGINYEDDGTTRVMDAVVDKRAWSVVSADFTFTFVLNEVDPIPTGYMEHILLTSHAVAGDGVELRDSLRMINEELPPEPDPDPGP